MLSPDKLRLTSLLNTVKATLADLHNFTVLARPLKMLFAREKLEASRRSERVLEGAANTQKKEPIKKARHLRLPLESQTTAATSL